MLCPVSNGDLMTSIDSTFSRRHDHNDYEGDGAETRRFELLKGLTPYLVSSEDCRVVLSLIYAYLTSLQWIYIVQIPATKANSWAKHGQKKSRPISWIFPS